jgi:hypothetical protein
MKVLGVIMVVGLCAALLLFTCRRSNNLLLGRVEATVGSHTVVVTDCYRIRVPPPQKLDDSSDGQTAYRFTPCRDADILMRNDELIVNGRSYGHINPADTVIVDHGKVSTTQ